MSYSLVLLTVPLLLLGYFVLVLVRFIITIRKTFNSFPDIPRPMPLSSFPFFDQMSMDGVKRWLAAHISPEGNLIHPISNLGANVDGKPTLVISDAEEFGKILTIEKFPKLDVTYDAMEVLLGNGLVLSKGEVWKKQRKNLTPIFHFQSLSLMPEFMTKRTLQFVDAITALKGQPVNPVPEFEKLTLRIVIDCVFGGSEFLDADVMSPLWHTANKSFNGYYLSRVLFGNTLNDFLPLPWNLKLKKSVGKIRALVKVAIEKKKAILIAGTERTGDLLESLLTVVDELTGEPIPENMIVDECLTFLFGGHDTTSSLLAWTMTFLSRDSTILGRIRHEVKNVVGDRTPDYDDVKNLRYCSMVLRETLRMRPPVYTVDRIAVEDCELVGKKVPAGTYVYPLFIAAHYDNRFWNEPWKFNPERFDSSNQATRHPYAFLPFSAKSRNCIGQKFAMMEATLILAILVSKFDIVSDTKPEDEAWQAYITIKPANFKCSFIPV